MSSENKKHKIIIDTDPGVDDAIAILLAVNHPDIELVGLTTVFGNLAATGATQNALDLLNQFGAPDIPVAKGEDKPLEKEPSYAHFVHGDNGLGNVDVPSSDRVPVEQSAAEFLVEQILANPHEITICAIAPLTNLAKALELEPKIASLVKQVVIMGGAVKTNGNVTPVAEANIFNDPAAADIVLTANWPVTLVGLDITMQIVLNHDFMKQVKAKGPGGELLYNISRFYDAFYKKANVDFDGFASHDATTLQYVTNPELFTCVQGPIRVSTDGITEGMTIIDTKMSYGDNPNPWTDKPKVNTCIDVDVDKIKQLLLEHLY